MSKKMKTLISVVLMFTLFFSFTATAHAGWFSDKVNKVKNTVKDTVNDAKDWTENAVDDVSDFVDDVLKDNPELSELDLLPVLTIDFNTVTNLQIPNTGSFKYGNNVKEKNYLLKQKKSLEKSLRI